MIRVGLTLVILGAIGAGIFKLGAMRQSVDAKALLQVADEMPLTVTVSQPSREDIVRVVQSPGDVEALLEVDVSSEIVAKIREMPVVEGDIVKKGDLLCRLDDKYLLADIESAKARIESLKAAISQAEIELDKAERDLNRQIKLSEADATSDLELRDFRTIRDRLKAALDMRTQEMHQSEASLKHINEDLLKTVIRAPIDGVISKLVAKQGEVVVTGTMNNPGTKIMTISDLSHMQVRARVDEVDIPLVQSDQPARIYLQSDQDHPVPARVVRVASKGTKQLGRDVVNFEVLLEVLSHENRVKPGMSSNVEIEVARSEKALTVPIEAVVHRMRKELPESIVAEFDAKSGGDAASRARQVQYLKVAFVMSKENKAEVRIIEPGIADTRRVELKGGIAEVDTVIVGPYRSLDQLKEGKRVALSEKDKKAKEKKDGEAGAKEEVATSDTNKNQGAHKEGKKDQPEAQTDDTSNPEKKENEPKTASAKP
ncbi:MAG: efflux RND transporter periplasmic adaptor subunit [Planctomycetes bacterium]|nr:efflux RND transporter periplasmic adaptor subunit [Planctomycetota bacterium]MBI3834905.1 efflux RND transporter periplasmic adaptor subunit [Planctomycetota bacterium]